MRRILAPVMMLLVLLALSGCVYQASLSQGNLLKKEDLEQVKVGMTPNQVRFLLGTPLVSDTFHRERWDYIYYLRVGRQKASYKRWVSIYFDGDAVTRIDNDQQLNPDI